MSSVWSWRLYIREQLAAVGRTDLTDAFTVIVHRESRGVPTATAKSTKAAGLFQFMPSLAKGNQYDPRDALALATATALRINRRSKLGNATAIVRGWRGSAHINDVLWLNSWPTLMRTRKSANAERISMLRLAMTKIAPANSGDELEFEYWRDKIGPANISGLTATSVIEPGVVAELEQMGIQV